LFGKSGSSTKTHSGLPLVLTVGLTPANVARPVEFIQPFGIGLATGVEFSLDLKIGIGKGPSSHGARILAVIHAVVAEAGDHFFQFQDVALPN
jgi:hypothetical protein